MFVNVNVICLPTEHQEFSRTLLKCLCIWWSNWNLEILGFEERGKQEYPKKNLSEQRREPTTNSTHIWHRVQESNPATLVGGKRSHHCAISAPLGVWDDNLYHHSRTPPYGHPVNIAISLPQPLYSDSNKAQLILFVFRELLIIWPHFRYSLIFVARRWSD